VSDGLESTLQVGYPGTGKIKKKFLNLQRIKKRRFVKQMTEKIEMKGNGLKLALLRVMLGRERGRGGNRGELLSSQNCFLGKRNKRIKKLWKGEVRRGTGNGSSSRARGG